VAHTFAKLLVHAVFSTKQRVPLIRPEWKPRLLGYVGGIVREDGGHLIASNAMPDHVHLLMTVPVTKTVADILRLVKTNSSRWVHDTWPELRHFAWQTGYGAFSVSRSNLETVEAYIANQEEHHRKLTFQEEFVALLKRHGIDYDETNGICGSEVAILTPLRGYNIRTIIPTACAVG
jgi:REP element-mobilizing transposase RayT